MKHFCFRLLITIAMYVVMAAPSWAAEQKIRFTSQDLLRAGQATTVAAAQRRVIQAFLAEYPQYEVTPFSMPTTAGPSQDSGPLMGIAAGTPPHAIYVNFRLSSTYIEQGFLEPVDVLLARVLSSNPRVREADNRGHWLADPTPQEITAAVAAIRERVPPAAWPVIYRADEHGRQHAWAVPTSTLVTALLYRKDLYRAAGLDPDRPPQNWDELLDFSRRLTVPERRQVGIGLAGGTSLSWSAYTLLASNGASIVEQQPTGEWRAVYDSPEAAEAVEYLWRLIKQPFQRDGRTIHGAGATVMRDAGELMWQRGQMAMKMAYLSDETIEDLNPQLVGVAPVPLSPRGTRASEINCRMLGVFSQGTPQQKIAVMRYIWFISGEQGQRIRTQVFVENGLGQFVNPDLLAKFGHDDVLKQVNATWRDAYRTAERNGVPEPYGRNTQTIWRVLSAPMLEALELPMDTLTIEQRRTRIASLLKQSAADVNLKVLGNIPPVEMRKRRIVAGVVMLAIVAAFMKGLNHVWRHFSKASAPMDQQRSRRSFAMGYLFIIPAMALIVWWEYIPLVNGLRMSLLDYRLVRESTFVAVDNFAAALFDETFWSSLWKTFYFLVLMIGLGFWPPILLAILLQEVPTSALKYLFRTIFYLPAVISGVVVMFLWRQLYDPTEHGVLNQILMSLNALGPIFATVIKLGLFVTWLALIGALAYVPWTARELSRALRVALWTASAGLMAFTVVNLVNADWSLLVGRFQVTPLRWIESPEMAMFCVVLPTVWAGTGPGCIIYLAALKTVPDDMYEAADIDGASKVHKVLYIVLPQLRYLICIQLIAAIIGAMKGGADYILALTGGGPNGATNILALEIFTRTFLDLRFGIGTAMAWMLGALLIGITAYQLKMLSRAEFKTGK